MKRFSLISILLVAILLPTQASSFKVLQIDPNGGTNTMIAHNLIYDIGASFVVTNPTRAGYTFAGWTGTGAKYLTHQEGSGFSFDELTFNGTSDYYDLGTAYKYTDKITINLWAYMDNWAEYATSNMRLISCTQSGGWCIQNATGDVVKFPCYDGTISGYRNGTTTVTWESLGSGWHMFTMVFDGRNVYGYIDGNLKVSSSIFADGKITYHESNSILLGAEAGEGNTPAGNYFKGKIKQLSISNAAISPTEVAAMYSYTKKNHGDNNSVLRYIMAPESASLKAKWTANAATTLRIDANGGVNKMSQDTYSQAAGTALTITNPTRSGYNFIGWEGTNNRFLSNYQGHDCSSPKEISFNGTSTYFNLGREFMFTNEMTFNLWAHMSNWGNYATEKMRLISCTETGGWNIEVNGEKIRFAIYDAGKGGYNSIALAKKWSDLAAGWHMFTLTFDGAVARAYIDGEFLGQSQPFMGKIGYHASNSILVGAEAGAGSTPAGNYFKGKIKNLAIMKVAIPDDEVQLLFKTSGLIRYYFPNVNKTIKALWQSDGSTEVVAPKVDASSCFVANGVLQVEGTQVAELELYSLLGQRIFSVKNSNELNVSGLKGVFVVRIIDVNNNSKAEKIVIK